MPDTNIMPGLGFGTFGRTGDEGIAAITTALETGYRHLDTAQVYNTERENGEAIRRSGIARNEIFVTTKIDHSNFADGTLIPSLEKSLEALQLDQVDLTLIHWPSPNGEIAPEVYLPQLAEAQQRGLTKHIGLSNFTIALIDKAEEILGPGTLLTNQVELNPFMQNRKLADYCMKKDIRITCYLPIAKGRLGDEPKLREIAERHNATVEQVAVAWELARGYAAIPTSSKAERIRSNFKALDLTLSPDDIELIDTIDRGDRRINPDWGPDWD
ncbi:2,5-diketo-D-gluconate reductase B [Devosia pacifica]|uniref:2,5-diketo-D-gluconate reductase B n=1 Tax=Devosia pacifica TaxID=1335967 RepID=A0A918SBV3_9HYPH|nr:aldo/keto reductase [Devosia pacifica]GHA32304.1 2,5-diketo-D-gluconate reductase B [Devosia pacifica]